MLFFCLFVFKFLLVTEPIVREVWREKYSLLLSSDISFMACSMNRINSRSTLVSFYVLCGIQHLSKTDGILLKFKSSNFVMNLNTVKSEDRHPTRTPGTLQVLST